MKPLNPELPAWFLFPASEARHDRLQITMEFSGLSPTEAAFHEVMETLASVSGTTPDEQPLFRADRVMHSLKYRLRLTPGWLFELAGAREAGTVRHDPRTGLVRFSLMLVLNPTRFLAHQGTTDIGQIAARPSEEALRAQNGQMLPRGLDGNDNLLSAEQMGGQYFEGRDQRWRGVIAVYLDHIQRLVAERVAQLSPEIFQLRSSIEFQAVQQTEVYWELEGRDAVTAVSELRNAVQRSAGTFRATCGLDHDAVQVRLPLTVDIELSIYAKTFERVRFEVRYRRPIRQLASRCGASGGNVLGDLGAVRSDAASRVAGVWRAIAPAFHAAEKAGDLFDFIDKLRRADLGEETRLLISLLGNNRGLTECSVPLATIKTLVRLGVLDPRVSLRHGGPKRYPLAVKWSLMFDILLGRADCIGQLVG